MHLHALLGMEAGLRGRGVVPGGGRTASNKPAGQGCCGAAVAGGRKAPCVMCQYATKQDVGQLKNLPAPDTALPPRKTKATSPVDQPVEVRRLLEQSVEEIAFPGTEDERWVATPHEPQPEPSTSGGCPVYVMLPLDTVWVMDRDGQSLSFIKKEKALELALDTFKRSGVEGVMVDVWWGISERVGPKKYDFSAYMRLFRKIVNEGLKVQAVMSFHAAGGNVGDTCKVPLPQWVLDIGEENPEIFYADKQGFRNMECLSLGCDDEPLFWGRTPIQMYKDFVEAFASTFSNLLGTVITEVTVGLGPAGELRYPAYPEGDGRWRFPGVGEFQCYDKYMLRDLKGKAEAAGHPEWAYDGGPHDAGSYNSKAWETGFFRQGGSFDSPYGRFFLDWYSGCLVEHADKVLGAVSEVLNRPGERKVLKNMKKHCRGGWIYEFESACQLGVKLAGVHWWFTTKAHAAELTAGYYNVHGRNGYEPIMDVLKKYNSRLSFTCVEMRDCEHPPDAHCSPQGLLGQVIETARKKGLRLAGENALQRYDEYALSRIMESAFGDYARTNRMEQITFLRMADVMFDNWPVFQSFLARMQSPPY